MRALGGDVNKRVRAVILGDDASMRRITRRASPPAAAELSPHPARELETVRARWKERIRKPGQPHDCLASLPVLLRRVGRDVQQPPDVLPVSLRADSIYV